MNAWRRPTAEVVIALTLKAALNASVHQEGREVKMEQIALVGVRLLGCQVYLFLLAT